MLRTIAITTALATTLALPVFADATSAVYANRSGAALNVIHHGGPLLAADLQAATVGSLCNGQSQDIYPTDTFNYVTVKNCSAYEFQGSRTVQLVRTWTSYSGTLGQGQIEKHVESVQTWTVTNIPANQSLKLTLNTPCSTGSYTLQLSRGDSNPGNDTCKVDYSPVIR